MYIYTDNVAFYLIILFYFSLFIQLCQISSLFHLFSLSFHDSLLCPKKEERRRGKRKTKSSPPQPCNTATQHHPHPLTITTNHHNQNKINPKSIEIKSISTQAYPKTNSKSINIIINSKQNTMENPNQPKPQAIASAKEAHRYHHCYHEREWQ